MQKRSKKIQLSLMGMASATVITACTESTPPVFTNVAQCAADPAYTTQECQQGMQYALEQQYLTESPRYSKQQSCETTYGADQCHSYQRSDGTSVWMPLLGGFLLGQALGNRGGGMQRDYYAYNHNTGWSWHNQNNGFTNRSAYAPRDLPKPKTASIPKPSKAHTKAITRGGFGARAARHTGYSFGG